MLGSGKTLLEPFRWDANRSATRSPAETRRRHNFAMKPQADKGWQRPFGYEPPAISRWR